MNNATLKINSYQNSNIILIDDEIIFELNALDNFKKDSPILKKAGEILLCIGKEFNLNYDLTVQGNLFEQELMKLYARNSSYCSRIYIQPFGMMLSTTQRLKMLSELGVKINHKFSLALDSDIPNIVLPSYPGISFTSGSISHNILISKDVEFLRSELEYSDEIAFCVNGESEIVDDNKIIIGCTLENVQELVTAYIETKYINPLIGTLHSKYYSNPYIKDPSTVRENCHYVISRIDPYYFVAREDSKVYFFIDETPKIKVQSISINETGEFVFNNRKDLRQISSRCTVTDEASKPSVSISDDGLFSLKAHTLGTATINLYFDDMQPIATITTFVRKHSYVESLSVTVGRGANLLVGNTYRVFVDATPSNAEDIDSITWTLEDTDVAEVVGDSVKINRVGTFKIKAHAAVVSKLAFFTTYDRVEKIVIENWTNDSIEITEGEHFTVKASVSPYTVYDKTVRCEILGDQNVLKKDKDKRTGTFIFKAEKPGNVQIRFSSVINPNVKCTKTVKVNKDKTELRTTILTIAGILVAIGLAIALILYLFSHYIWPWVLLVLVIIGLLSRLCG